jgi:hypothetical protein
MTNRIGKRREEADAKIRKLFPRFFISVGLLLICIVLVPDGYAVLPTVFSITACWLSGKAIDVEMARVAAYNESIDVIISEWTLSLDSILAMLGSVLPPVEPDREINNE